MDYVKVSTNLKAPTSVTGVKGRPMIYFVELLKEYQNIEIKKKN